MEKLLRLINAETGQKVSKKMNVQYDSRACLVELYFVNNVISKVRNSIEDEYSVVPFPYDSMSDSDLLCPPIHYLSQLSSCYLPYMQSSTQVVAMSYAERKMIKIGSL